jgi:hypothetical protein
MSDKADEDAIGDKQAFYELAARNGVALVVGIVEGLGAEADDGEKGLAREPTSR